MTTLPGLTKDETQFVTIYFGQNRRNNNTVPSNNGNELYEYFKMLSTIIKDTMNARSWYEVNDEIAKNLPRPSAKDMLAKLENAKSI